ncbi:3-carboxy-cis,cis-muconate cycloisomerase, partial [Streptomyces goshikiensis]
RAKALLTEASERAGRTGRPLGEVLADLPEVSEHLGADRLRELLDPVRYTGAAPALVDRALACDDTH